MYNSIDGIYDSHIHLNYGRCDDPAGFLKKAQKAGVRGGNIFSPAPHHNIGLPDGDYRWQARLEYILNFTAGAPGFAPFFWFDPTEKDMVKQIETAAEMGVKGYKIICESYYPKDCIPACEVIAAAGKPVMFHSGILDGKRDVTAGRMNRPIEFECLFSVRNLQFSMAHLGWPWVDEYIGMTAKSFFSWDPEFNNRMYFDTTPGTPGFYREDALRKLYLCCYPVQKLVLWGTDCSANDYEFHIADYWLKLDTGFMAKINEDREIAHQPYMDAAPDLSHIFELAAKENWKKFLNI